MHDTSLIIESKPRDVESAKLAQHMRRFRMDTPTVVMAPLPNLRMSGSEEANQLDNIGKLKKVVIGAVSSGRELRTGRLTSRDAARGV